MTLIRRAGHRSSIGHPNIANLSIPTRAFQRRACSHRRFCQSLGGDVLRPDGQAAPDRAADALRLARHGARLEFNPAHAVRGPKHVVRKGKTPVLSPEEVRQLLGSIEAETLMGLRDRALIALMTYTFARVGAAVKMRVEDYFIQGRRSDCLEETGS